jgi:rhodanese-related sulfurtransferase
MSDNKMTLNDFHDKHQKLGKDEVILDVRRAEEFAEGHIAGAINISHEQVLDHVEELKKYKLIYIHCKRGGRANTAYEALKGAGLNNMVCIYDAGMDAWMERGYPVTR